MRVHGSVPGVRMEAKVELGLERRRWMVGCTSELGAAATAGAVRCPSNAREGELCGASGEPNGAHAGQVAWQAGPMRVSMARGRGDGAHSAARPTAARARAIARACGREAVGPATMADAWPLP
jgi:hypothetical protein